MATVVPEKYVAQTRRSKQAPGSGRGGAILPLNPTGRLVLGPAFEKGSDRGAMGVSHWLPAEGITWTCPSCGELFVRDADAKGEPWRTVAAI